MTGGEPFLRTFADPGAALQRQADAAVVMSSILRPSIEEALASVLGQDFPGRIHVLVGVDVPGDVGPVERACARRRPGDIVQVLWPGYSTSVRHGGLCPARDGGVLRQVLTRLANSPHVAYLDDDNWWAPDHLATLRSAVEGAAWAHALRWFVHPATRRPICVDRWESVGPDRGVFRERFGGFVDPNCLMIDKRRCGAAVEQWINPLPGDPKGMSADRNVFAALRGLPCASTGEATAFYALDPADGLHAHRLRWMGDAWDEAAVRAGGRADLG